MRGALVLGLSRMMLGVLQSQVLDSHERMLMSMSASTCWDK